MSVADAIKRLVELGASADMIAAAVEGMVAAAKGDGRSAGAERQARYRERHKASQVTDSDACDGANATLPETKVPTPLKTQPLPVTPSDPKGSSAPKPRRAEEPEGFAEWYTAYPRHSGRDAAARAYAAALRRGATRDELFAGAQRYATERAGEPAEFTKLPATWLNAGCWKDEPQAPRNHVNGRRYAPGHQPQRTGVDAVAAGLGRYLSERGLQDEGWPPNVEPDPGDSGILDADWSPAGRA